MDISPLNIDSSELSLTIRLGTEQDTFILGRRLGASKEPGLLIFLEGDLGAGKTTVARGFLRAQGISGNIKSPTFSLVESYEQDDFDFVHMDLFRLESSDDFFESGFYEYLEFPNICIVEWPQKAQNQLKNPDLIVKLESLENFRKAYLHSRTEAGAKCLKKAFPKRVQTVASY